LEELYDPSYQAQKEYLHMVSLTLSLAIDGFEQSLRARFLSKHTQADYHRTLMSFAKYLEDNPMVARIGKDQVEQYLASQSNLSKKSLLNRYIGLSAFWTWCVADGQCKVHILKKIIPPKPEQKIIDPFSEDEIRAILAAVNKSRAYNLKGVEGRVEFSLPFAIRNRALIMMLLDTGLRASEICSISIKNLDLKALHVKVMGKGDKERQVPFGQRTAEAVRKYINTRRDIPRPEDPLFLSRGDRRLTREELAHTLASIGIRAKLNGRCHPHRFRHTFAVTYLRNGGNALALQAQLGHSTLEMVRRYVQLTSIDLAEVHRRASPADNWRL
jgi:site-specific recombinase XerD